MKKGKQLSCTIIRTKCLSKYHVTYFQFKYWLPGSQIFLSTRYKKDRETKQNKTKKNKLISN